MCAAEKIHMAPKVSILVAMAREGGWLCADACAFLLGMLTPKVKANRRGFLEHARYAHLDLCMHTVTSASNYPAAFIELARN
jgi:hypothetical protein